MQEMVCALVAACDFNELHFRERDSKGLFDRVIAVDAGFAHLKSTGRVPDDVIGDFDSLGYVPDHENVVSYPSKKDKSDLELAFERALELGCTDVFVYGALGGRLDHTVANLQLFARYGEMGAKVTAIAPDCAARIVVGPGACDLPQLAQGTVSVFAMTPEARGVVERGMEYSLDGETLSNRTSWGLSNELKGEAACVSVKEGTLLVFHPLA